MINRKSLGSVEIGNSAYVSIPTDVDDAVGRFQDAHPAIKIEPVGGIGYHNAGWTYQEYKVSAASPGAAMEAAEELNGEAMSQFHWSRNA